MPKPTCQSCGQEITWRITTDGRRIPLDPLAHPEGIVRMLDGGTCRILSKVNAAEARANGAQLWMPHHATCPTVERHRVPRAQMALDL